MPFWLKRCGNFILLSFHSCAAGLRAKVGFLGAALGARGGDAPSAAASPHAQGTSHGACVQRCLEDSSLASNPEVSHIITQHLNFAPRLLLTLSLCVLADSIAVLYSPSVNAKPILTFYVCNAEHLCCPHEPGASNYCGGRACKCESQQ